MAFSRQCRCNTAKKYLTSTNSVFAVRYKVVCPVMIRTLNIKMRETMRGMPKLCLHGYAYVVEKTTAGFTGNVKNVVNVRVV